MKNGSPVDSASSLIIKVLEASVLAPVSVGILLFAPTVAADELICTVAEDHGSHQYLIDIDDDGGKVIVTNPKTNKPMPVTVAELTPQRVLLGFNSLALNPMEFVRQGKVVSLPLTINRAALVDRSTNRMIEAGFVTDDKGEVVSLEQIHAMEAEEEAYRRKHKNGPRHPKGFWLLFEVGTFRSEGVCDRAPPSTR